MTDAQGAGQANDAAVDKSYADTLRVSVAEQKKAAIAAAENKVKKQEAHLAAAKEALAQAKKENG